jgi:DNA-binding GntR family transcriptional regulator
MYEPVFRALASAAEIACRRMTSAQLTALHGRVEEACQLPIAAGWDRKAAAHADFFRVLAEVGGDPVAAPVLVSGGELAYDLMVTAGRPADGIVVNSRRRFLESLRTGDAAGAALELEDHFRILHVMCRLTGRWRIRPFRGQRQLTETSWPRPWGP